MWRVCTQLFGFRCGTCVGFGVCGSRTHNMMRLVHFNPNSSGSKQCETNTGVVVQCTSLSVIFLIFSNPFFFWLSWVARSLETKLSRQVLLSAARHEAFISKWELSYLTMTKCGCLLNQRLKILFVCLYFLTENSHFEEKTFFSFRILFVEDTGYTKRLLWVIYLIINQ